MYDEVNMFVNDVYCYSNGASVIVCVFVSGCFLKLSIKDG